LCRSLYAYFFYRAYTTSLCAKDNPDSLFVTYTLQNKNIGRFFTELARILAPSVVWKQALLLAIQRPEFNICGLRRSDLKNYLPYVSAGKLSRFLKRVAKTYRYYLTRNGRAAVATC